MRALLWTAIVAAGCAPTVRAGDYFAAPLRRVTPPRAPLEARFRVLPPPAGCAPRAAPIVFLPALGLTQHSWAGVNARLDACRARVLVDAPGIGESPVAGRFEAADALAAIVAVIDAASDGGRVVLAGHSLGGAMATRLAAQLGDRVEALVLVAAPVDAIALDRWERLLLHDWLWPPYLHLAGAYSGIGLGLRQLSRRGDAIGPVDLALIAADWSDRQRRNAIVGYYRAFLEPERIVENGAALDRVRAPTLLVWGDDDHIVPLAVERAAAARLAAHVPVTTRIVPGIGHLVPLAAPRVVAEAIDALLATTNAPRVDATEASPTSTPSPGVTSPPSLAPATATPPPPSMQLASGGRQPGDLVWSSRRELFPLVGVGSLFTVDGRTDLSLVAGLARGGIDRRYPVEAGRVAFTAGAAMRSGPGDGWSFAYLRATARLELVWRWAGGYHVDGTLLVDPRAGHVGGYGALGYTASAIPWLRGFIAGGRLPGDGSGGRLLFGVELDARLTGWLY